MERASICCEWLVPSLELNGISAFPSLLLTWERALLVLRQALVQVLLLESEHSSSNAFLHSESKSGLHLRGFPVVLTRSEAILKKRAKPIQESGLGVIFPVSCPTARGGIGNWDQQWDFFLAHVLNHPGDLHFPALPRGKELW